jgi:DNA invertase Pin-like site-specific DNA recombinase
MKYVTYKRVSTKKQGDSGLGLEAQKRDLALYFDLYVKHEYELIGELTDIESGKAGVERPNFDKAVALAKTEKACLLVAKLDRVSRDVETIAGLIKRVDFKVACMPHADRFQLHLFAALAEQEREFISQRTKAALTAASERGVILGGLRDKTNARNKAKKDKAQYQAEKMRGVIEPMNRLGKSTREIAYELNNSGLRTSQGSRYQSAQVHRILQRLGLGL